MNHGIETTTNKIDPSIQGSCFSMDHSFVTKSHSMIGRKTSTTAIGPFVSIPSARNKKNKMPHVLDFTPLMQNTKLVIAPEIAAESVTSMTEAPVRKKKSPEEASMIEARTAVRVLRNCF